MPENREDDQQLIDRFGGHGINRDNAAHFRGRLERRLLMSRCGDCGRWQHPSRPMCPDCWSWNMTPEEVSGRGTIHLLMELHQGPPAEGVDYRDGHPVVTVELEEQPALRFTSTVTADFPDDDLEIGAPVELEWIDRDGTPMPVFRTRSA
ncbi:MAG: zinc ribbon domain-containing protein [Acidimicrobiales bacterium]